MPLLASLLSVAPAGTLASAASPILAPSKKEPTVTTLERRMRVAVPLTNGRPFVIYDEQEAFRGGLARDIVDDLAQQLSLTPIYLNVPRARVEPWLRTDRIDMGCFLAPAWVAQPGSLYWSPPLFEIRQVIVSPAQTRPIRGELELQGLRVGTLLNYVYPELQPLFGDGRVRRVDAPSDRSNLSKLHRGRIDAFIDVDLAVLHAQASGSLPLAVRIDPLWAPANPVHCAFSPAFAGRHPELAIALADAVRSGRVEQWISRYTGGRRVPAPPQ